MYIGFGTQKTLYGEQFTILAVPYLCLNNIYIQLQYT